jgi:hypothetical protein
MFGKGNAVLAQELRRLGFGNMVFFGAHLAHIMPQLEMDHPRG